MNMLGAHKQQQQAKITNKTKSPEIFFRFAFFRKVLVSVKLLSAILGPEMGAPILWTPGKNAFFLQEKTHVHKIPRFRGGYFGFLGGGGGVPILFLWARGFF